VYPADNKSRLDGAAKQAEDVGWKRTTQLGSDGERLWVCSKHHEPNSYALFVDKETDRRDPHEIDLPYGGERPSLTDSLSLSQTPPVRWTPKKLADRLSGLANRAEHLVNTILSVRWKPKKLADRLSGLADRVEHLVNTIHLGEDTSDEQMRRDAHDVREPKLSSPVTLKDRALWFGEIELYEDEIVISGWTWTDPVKEEIPLSNVKRFHRWPPRRKGQNFHVSREDNPSRGGRIEKGLSLWTSELEDEGVEVKRQ
jgi:hypothetical protein